MKVVNFLLVFSNLPIFYKKNLNADINLNVFCCFLLVIFFIRTFNKSTCTKRFSKYFQ